MPIAARFLIRTLATLLLGVVAAHAQTPVFASAQSIAGGDVTTRVAPVERALTLSTAGLYHVTLTDLAQPSAFAEVTLAITSGDKLVGSATVTGGGAPAVALLNASAGSYVVHIVAALANGAVFGTAGVQLTDANGNSVNGFAGAGNTQVSGFTAVLSLAPEVVPANARVIDTMIAISSADTYELDLKDLQFPAALATLEVSLADPSGNLVAGFPLSAAGGLQSVTFAVTTPGNYHLVGGAQAGSGASGALYNIRVFSTTSGTEVLNESDSLGSVATLGAVALSAGAYNLSFRDFAFPVALSQGTAVAVQGGGIVANTTGGSPAPFTATAANCQVFALAVPDATAGSGAYGVSIAPQAGGAAVFSSVQATSNGTGGASAYTYPVAIPAGGSYTLTVTDFQFPISFGSLHVAVAQNGALVGTPLTSAGSLVVSPAAGQLFVLAAATPGAGGKGLFGVNLAPTAGGSAVLDLTQGVGAAFGTAQVSIASAGSYNINLSDLSFPGNFSELAAVVTQGPSRIGAIYNTGTFTVSVATPGTYLINVLGVPQPILPTSAQTAGTYGVSVVPTPTAPTVQLSSDASQVDAGGTVTLTWSSTNTSSCTASGGWTGALATSGKQVSPAISTATTFTINCAGAGGSATQSVTVSVTSTTSGKGGSGAVDGLWLSLLGLALASRLGSRRRSGDFSR